MWVELPSFWIAVLNGLGIPAAHLGISWLFTVMPIKWFRPGCFPFTRLPGESRQLYERVFRVKAWKSVLPDAGPWFGGFAKKQLRSSDPVFMAEFVRETCRSEAAHWVQWLVISGFSIWTPMPWAWVILIYAPLSNLPCILLQRHNRLRLSWLLGRSAGLQPKP